MSNTTYRLLIHKINKKKITLGVIGLGYVGFPLAVEFAKRGIPVWGMDVDRDRIARIKNRQSYVSDVSSSELRRVLASGKLTVSEDLSLISTLDVVIICVPTPLKRKYHPDISFIEKAIHMIARYLRKKTLVILESTTYPGTTKEVILPYFVKKGFAHNKDFFLVFSPERIDPGNKKFPLRGIPKIVGGITPEATQLAVAVYRHIIKKVVPVSSARTAEAVKLLENTFRLINIGLIDELAMMCDAMGIDIWEVIDAAKTKPFGFMPFYPGPGVGGHCIPKDPLYLYWKARRFGFKSRFIKLSSEIINAMPEYIVQRLARALKAKKKTLKRARFLIIGVTYKKDIKDLRKSPALDVIVSLKKKGALVSYFDPLIPYLSLSDIHLTSEPLTKKTIPSFDCTVILTDHTNVDYGLLRAHSRFIFDTRNVYTQTIPGRIERL